MNIGKGYMAYAPPKAGYDSLKTLKKHDAHMLWSPLHKWALVGTLPSTVFIPGRGDLRVDVLLGELDDAMNGLRHKSYTAEEAKQAHYAVTVALGQLYLLFPLYEFNSYFIR